MKKEFDNLPRAIQKQVLLRGGFALMFFAAGVALGSALSDPYIFIPAFVILGLGVGSALHLLYLGVTKGYVIIRGVCEEAIKTVFTRRIKTLYIKTDEHTICVSPRHHLRRMPAGTSIEVYVASNTLVREKDGVQVLLGYIAMSSVRGAVETHDSSRESV